MLHILYSTEAGENLHYIFSYSADKWEIEQARKYYSQLADAFSLLAKNPKLGHKHSYIAGNYYTYPVGSHFIIYRFTRDDIVIIAIIHMAMNIENRINKLIENINK